jgi:alpha-L-rhamnosidase
MEILNCKTNHLDNPIGFDLTNVVFSWIVEDTISQYQDYSRIIVSKDFKFDEILYDSKETKNLDNRYFELKINLEPCKRYYWKVIVKGNEGDIGESEVQYFETGKMDTSWKANWITTLLEDKEQSPYIRKTFEIKKAVKSARAYIIGLGLYELEINGEKVGNEKLTPYCNAYDSWLQYQTYDISNHLKKGSNAAGVILGNGWAKTKFGAFKEESSPYINDFALLCELVITYENGDNEIIITDETWKFHESPILENSIYDGEVYDSTKEISGWSTVNIDDSNWENTKLYTPKNLGSVVDRLSPPVLVKETLQPDKLLNTPLDEYVLDMGQNMVGWLKIKINEPKGTKIKISFGEVLQDGNFYRENLRSAKQEFIYISDGKEKIIEPHFTFYGFRYAKLEGFKNPINKDNFIGCVVYSDLETIGHIETSNHNVNRLFLNALWGQKGNFLDVPTDCPQRDERMGWTGDAQVFSGTALFNMDSYAFYTKYMHDLYQEQKSSDGMVNSTVPTFLKDKKNNSFVSGGSCAWGDAATVIPWEMYLHTGDPTILKRQYKSMKDWVDWISKQAKKSSNEYLWNVGFHFGDWLALDGPVEGGVMGGTDKGLLASAYYRLSTNILSKSAKILNYDNDHKYYKTLSEKIKKAIQDEFFSKNGRSTINTQTAHVVALQFDLVEENVKNRVLDDLKTLLKGNSMHLKTGFVGTPYLCRVLSDYGNSENAYNLFLHEDYPSWLYEVTMGATTIWERWNSILPDGKISDIGMNSLNHYAYGSIVEWMYRNMCGIKPVEDNPGFKHIIISPEIFSKLNYAKATLNSSMGKIYSGWNLCKDGSLTITVSIPFDSTATVILPMAKLSDIKGINKAKSTQDGNNVTIQVKKGEYTFKYTPIKNFKKSYSIASPFWELKNNPKTKKILKKYLPHIVDENSKLDIQLPYSIQEILSFDGFLRDMFLRNADVDKLNEELKSI